MDKYFQERRRLMISNLPFKRLVTVILALLTLGAQLQELPPTKNFFAVLRVGEIVKTIDGKQFNLVAIVVDPRVSLGESNTMGTVLFVNGNEPIYATQDEQPKGDYRAGLFFCWLEPSANGTTTIFYGRGILLAGEKPEATRARLFRNIPSFSIQNEKIPSVQKLTKNEIWAKAVEIVKEQTNSQPASTAPHATTKP